MAASWFRLPLERLFRFNSEVRSTLCVRHVLLEKRVRSFIVRLFSFLTAPFHVVTNRIFFTGTASDLPSTFFCFCVTRVRSLPSELRLLLPVAI